MSISIYTNENEINRRLTNTGKYLEPKDEFIISQNTKEQTSFGLCENDIIEFSVYDINNNLLTQNNGQSIRYIKYPDTLNYIKLTATNEIAVNVQSLLSEAGFTTGLLKANINFVRQKAGDETQLRKFYIQEISATREEIRVTPLVVANDAETTQLNLKELVDMQDLNVDSTTYLNHIKNIIGESETVVAQKARTYIDNLFPEVDSDYIETVLKQDFQMQSSLDEFITTIYKNIQESVNQRIATIQESSCDVVPATELDNTMEQYILQAVNNGVYSLFQRVGTFGTFGASTGDVIERNAEEMFELAQGIATQGITENTVEYISTDLSNIKVTQSNVDNFAVLQKQLNDKINGTSTSTDTGTVTDSDIISTGTGTRSSTLSPSGADDTTTTTTEFIGFTTSTTTTTTSFGRTLTTTSSTTTTTTMSGGPLSRG